MTSQTAPPSEASRPTRFQVGSLSYTPFAMLNVFIWMLLGNFCLQIMEELPTSLVPLQLRWVSASDALIGFVTGSLPAFLGIFLNPFVGVWSDGYRGALGRRRPFLLGAMPVVVCSLMGLGLADQAAHYFSGLLGLGSVSSFKIGWIGGFMILFVVGNTFVLQIYQFLFVDVIPAPVMGKFIGFYRALGALGTFCFHYFLFGKAESSVTSIYLLASVLYAISFSLLIWQVKEGEYPPPARNRVGLWANGKTYFKESFGHPFFWKTYSLAFFFWSAVVPLWAFAVFFGTQPGGGLTGYEKTIGMSLDQFGKLRGLGSMVSVPIFFIIGHFVDRFHPLRICMVGLALCLGAFLTCFGFAHNPATFTACWLLIMVCWAVYVGAVGALLPRLMDRTKYGQFASANQIFGFSGVVLSPILCGWLIQALHDYRYLFIWCAGCTALCLVMCYQVFKDWKKLGGDTAYQPPQVSGDATSRTATAHPFPE